ncbi:hypothetical protein ARGLB_037_00520 [Arthrobacter globiformis NBRC 12137]|uniref:Uncharacterized protein n=1 Tax=Arthrobacter globiformis (strain ATCC 8010 / DSM 20124 / JCM 1332 / NBRC 12137 / NCIMB 8907 / NRRL B-2979 / 168) TaxID=1077972 RepID=H0QKK3_ARTG1|nr:hypothetical protein ARGLB_037_00520 [Arthrobacter globiformis NBRC 12137]
MAAGRAGVTGGDGEILVVPAKLSAALPSLGLFAVGHAWTMQVKGFGGNGLMGSLRVPVQKMAAAMKGGTLP